MAIEFHCVACNKLLRTGDDTAGKTAKCPICGTVMAIPATGGASDTGSHRDSSARAFATAEDSPSRYSAHGGTAQRAPIVLDIGDIFGSTWNVFKVRAGECILATLLPVLIVGGTVGVFVLLWTAIAGIRSWFLFTIFLLAGGVGITLLAICLGMGVLRAFLKIARGRRPSPSEALTFDEQLAPFVSANMLLVIIVAIGLVFFVVPGIVLGVMFSQVPFLVLDRRMAVFDAFEQSKALTEGNRLHLFLIWLIATVAATVVNNLSFLLGVLVTTPFLMLMSAVIYLRLTGESLGEKPPGEKLP
jgi:phage FluMu protein Com